MGKYGAIVTEIQRRLVAANSTGKPLDGWRVTNEPVSRVESVDDLPSVGVQGAELVEEYGTPPKVQGTVKLAIMIATQRKLGVANFLAGVEAVMDAIELDGSTFDGTLGGLLTEWPTFELADAGIGDMSMSAMVVVVARPTTFNRGQRRS